jgi:tetratricopeptide (TPR) repeat protein
MKTILALVITLTFSFSDIYAQRKKKKEEPDLPNKVGESMSRGDEKNDDRQLTLSAEREFLAGMKFFALEDYPKALESFQKSLKINPKSSGIHYQIAETFFRLKKISRSHHLRRKSHRIRRHQQVLLHFTCQHLASTRVTRRSRKGI